MIASIPLFLVVYGHTHKLLKVRQITFPGFGRAIAMYYGVMKDTQKKQGGDEMRDKDSFNLVVHKSWDIYIRDIKRAAQRRTDAVMRADKIYANAVHQADRNHLNRTEAA
jgi:hypothetical protein